MPARHLVFLLFLLPSILAAYPTAERIRSLPADTTELIDCDTIGDAELAAMARLKSLEVLDIGRLSVSEKGLESLSGLTSLRVLRLGDRSGMNPDYLPWIAKLTNLEVLEIAAPVLADDEQMAPLLKLANLRELTFCGFMGTDAGLASLRELPRLECLALQFAPELTDDDLAGLQELPVLKSLHFARCEDLTNDAMKVIGKLTNLEELYLDAWIWRPPSFTTVHYTPWTGEGLKYLSALKNLRRLSLWGSDKLRDEDLKIVAGFKQLEYLNISDSRGITDAGIRHLAALPRLRVLKAWDLHEERMAGEGFDAFGPESRLEELSFHFGGRLSDDGMAAIAALPRLRSLDLTEVFHVDEGALRHLSAAAELREFRMRWQDVSNDDLAAICKSGKLEVLRIGEADGPTENGLSSVWANKGLREFEWYGADHLSVETIEQFSRLPRLEVLELPNTQLTPGGIDALSRLKHLRELHVEMQASEAAPAFDSLASLEVLALGGRDVVDDAVLEQLAKLPRLRWLQVNPRAEITPDGVAALNASGSLFCVFLYPGFDERREELTSRIGEDSAVSFSSGVIPG